MKKFAGSAMLSILVLFLFLSCGWAGDSEVQAFSTDEMSRALPLTEPEFAATPENTSAAEVAPAVEASKDTGISAAAQAVDAVPAAAMEETAKAAAEVEANVSEMLNKVAPEKVALPEPEPAPKDDLTIAAELIDQEGLENYKKALDLCMAVVQKEPNNFKANWMAARACRLYGMEAQELGLANWEDLCKRYGKKGMAYAEKAISLEPDQVNGYYWYGMDVGIYSDSVSIVTALKEGLKDKTQNSFEKAYKIDKYYEDAGPIAALGRFWAVLPWPLNDDDLAMEYYREYQKTEFFGTPDNVQVNVYFAELLMDSRKTRDEARALLEQVPKMSDNKYWNAKAKELLDDL